MAQFCYSCGWSSWAVLATSKRNETKRNLKRPCPNTDSHETSNRQELMICSSPVCACHCVGHSFDARLEQLVAALLCFFDKAFLRGSQSVHASAPQTMDHHPYTCTCPAQPVDFHMPWLGRALHSASQQVTGAGTSHEPPRILSTQSHHPQSWHSTLMRFPCDYASHNK